MSDVPQWVVWLIAGVVFLLLVIVQVIVQAKKPVRKAIGGILTGIIALIAVNVSGFFTCSFPHAVRQSTARNIGISFFINFLLLKCLIYKCTVTGKEYTY